MVGEWDAQNILTRSISYDILGVRIMDMVYWYFKLLQVMRLIAQLLWHIQQYNNSLSEGP